MQKWTIGKRIAIGFAAVLVIILALGLFVRSRLNVIQTGTTNVATANIPALELLGDAKEKANEVLVLTYKHIGSPDATDMDQLEAKIKADADQVTKDYDDFDKVASPQSKVLLEDVRARLANYRTVRAQILIASRSATNAETSAIVYQKARTDLDPLTSAYIDSQTKCVEQVKKESDQSGESVLSATGSSNRGLLIGVAAALLIGCGLACLITRSTTTVLQRVSTSLSESSNQVVSASSQVTSASQTLAEGANTQASSLEETSSSLEEMTSMAQRNRDGAQKANELAKEARTAAERGVTDMQTMAAAMDAIKSSSDDIAKIIKTIDEIAFQTNILALNAAVEAARAGEAGMGFAVVADEVRNLAQRCAQAAKETAGKIEGAIVKTGQGVELSGKVAQALNEIVAKVREVDDLAAEAVSGSQEQTQGITQINAAVGQMDKITQSNAATAEEAAAAAQELNAQAMTMKQSVAELLQLVGGETSRNERATNLMSASNRPEKLRPAPSTVKRTFSKARNGHVAGAPALGSPDKSRNQIPMEADFKDF